MSYEPRSRGMRSRRISSKKPASKEKREGEESQFAYQEIVPVNPEEVSARAVNALDHLGNQRFGMPPFSEHFRRWIVDIESVIGDFKSSLPETVIGNLDDTVAQLVSNIRNELETRIKAEEVQTSNVTETLKELADTDRAIAELDSQQRIRVHEAKRATEKSVTKLRGEIDALDAERLRLLKQKPTFLERLLGSAKTKVESSSRSLHSKQSDLTRKEERLMKHIDVLRSDYTEKRKPLAARQAQLRQKLAELRSTTMDDAVDLRKAACEQLRQMIPTILAKPTAEQANQSEQ
jgi:hypothetical protein